METETRIMVVEDDVVLAQTLELILASDGYAPVVARDGRAALDLLVAGERPALIVSDIRMPVMDGYELLQEVRARPALEGIPFIFLTAKAAIADLRTGLALGADDYIPKPFEPDDILRSVRLRLHRVEKLRQARDRQTRQLMRYLPQAMRAPLDELAEHAATLAAGLAGTDAAARSADIVLRRTRQLEVLLDRIALWQELDAKVSQLPAIEPALYLNSGWRGPLQEQLLGIAAAHGRERDLTFALELSALRLPANLLGRVMGGLVDNAARFSPPGTAIEVVGAIVGSHYRLAVSDRGPGFAATGAPPTGSRHPFDTNGGEVEGVGFGLPTCRLFARYAGAEFFIGPRPDGAGCEAGFTLHTTPS